MSSPSSWLVAASLVALIIAEVPARDLREDLSISDLDTDEVREVTGDVGLTVRLPCMHANNVSKSSIRLILWYRHNSGAPFYSYDTRGRALLDGAHWSEDSELGRRAELDPGPLSPELLLRSVNIRDAGVYRCRADLRNQPTFNSLVKLIVSVPAESPQLLEKRTGKVLAASRIQSSVLVGPYQEGDSVQITCLTRGGVPLPNVTWWLQGTLLDSSWQRREQVTANTLTLSNVSRQLVADEFMCQVANSKQIPPQSISFRLNLYLAPSSLSLYRSTGVPGQMMAGRKYEFSCVVTGAQPSPAIYWTKDNILLNHSEQVQYNTSVVVSTLTLEVEWKDHGSTLTCRGGSSSTTFLQQSLQLNIHYAPLVNITLGKSLVLDSILEGRDVYFECQIDANPAVNSVQWYRNGVLLHGDKSAGVIVSGVSLALQSVSRQFCSHFSCSAENQIAEVFSSDIYLDVKYVPRCKSGQKKMYGSSLLSPVDVYCTVDANPAAGLVFSWFFNNTGEAAPFNSSQYTRVNDSCSLLRYVPRTRLDYGSISCSAENSVGKQHSVCLFHVVPMELPDPPALCTEVNRSITWLQLHCREEKSEVPTSYRLEVISLTGEQVYSWQQTSPHFLIENLSPAHTYTVLVYAENSGGQSEPAELMVVMSPDPAHQRTGLVIAGSSRGGEHFYKWNYTWTLVASCCVALFSICAAIAAVWMRHAASRCRQLTPPTARAQPDSDIQQLTKPRQQRQQRASADISCAAMTADFISTHDASNLYLHVSEADSGRGCVSCERLEERSGCQKLEEIDSCSMDTAPFSVAVFQYPCTRLPERFHFGDKQLLSRNSRQIAKMDAETPEFQSVPIEFQDSSAATSRQFQCN